MHKTTHVVATVTGIPRGGRTPKAYDVRRRAELDIPDIPEADIVPVVTIENRMGGRLIGRAPEGEAPVNPQFGGRPTQWDLIAGPGPQIYSGYLREGQVEGRAFNSLVLRIGQLDDHGLRDDVPPMREVQTDDTDEKLAQAAAAAALTGYVAGRGYLVRADEPYIIVDESHGRYSGITIYDGWQGGHGYNGFRLDQLEDAIACARGLGATEADVRHVRENLSITVHAPERLRFDPPRSALLRAASVLKSALSSKVHVLPMAKAVAWLQLRDAMERESRNGTVDPYAFLEEVRSAHDHLISEIDITQREKHLLRTAIEAAEAISPAALEDPEGELAGFNI